MLDPLLSALTFLFYTKIITTQYETTIRPDRQEVNIQSGQGEQQTNLVGTSTDGKNISSWRGKISIYSATWGGCLGCKKYFDENGQLYYRMANGEILDDGNFTIAFNYLPLGSRVSLVNRDNAKSVAATVTDRGGFEECCGRIADLSVAVANALDAKTDSSLIEIIKIEGKLGGTTTAP